MERMSLSTSGAAHHRHRWLEASSQSQRVHRQLLEACIVATRRA